MKNSVRKPAASLPRIPSAEHGIEYQADDDGVDGELDGTAEVLQQGTRRPFRNMGGQELRQCSTRHHGEHAGQRRSGSYPGTVLQGSWSSDESPGVLSRAVVEDIRSPASLP
ncbi:MAG: hypothetical protein ACLT2I_03125 [Corynebacterium variabile]